MHHDDLRMRPLTQAALDAIPAERHRNDQTNCFMLGLNRWLEDHPELESWEAWRPGHVLEFRDWLLNERKLSPATVSHYVNPLRLAARRVALYHPDAAKQLFVRRTIPTPPAAPVRFLFPDQLADVVQTAHDAGDAPTQLALVIGGLTGLRTGEIVALRASDFDGARVTVREAKSPAGVRVLPVCAQAARALTICFALWPAFPIKRVTTLSHSAREHLDATAARTGDATFSQVDFYEATRKTFTNAALHGGADSRYLDAYIGHAPDDVLTRHYADLRPRPDDLPRVLDAKCTEMIRRVVDPLEKNLHHISFFA